MRVVGYSATAWERLGRAVYAERTEQGYTTPTSWSAATGVSTRTLLSLERGIAVSGGTLTRIARTLGWNTDRPWSILDGQSEAPVASANAPISDSDLLIALASRLGAGQPSHGTSISPAAVLATLRQWREAELEPALARLLDLWIVEATALVSSAAPVNH